MTSKLPPLYVGANDNTLKVDGLRDADGNYVNDATVTCSVLDAADTAIITDIPMTFVPGSDGNYRGVLDSSTPLIAGRVYTAVFSAVGTSGEEAEKEKDYAAVVRKC